jgi:hypothetical protein
MGQWKSICRNSVFKGLEVRESMLGSETAKILVTLVIEMHISNS